MFVQEASTLAARLYATSEAVVKAKEKCVQICSRRRKGAPFSLRREHFSWCVMKVATESYFGLMSVCMTSIVCLIR